MRLLLYFLALLTGFSAAEAARPVEAASPTSAASQMDLAEAFAAAAVHVSQARPQPKLEAITRRSDATDFVASAESPVEATPVSRAERAHE